MNVIFTVFGGIVHFTCVYEVIKGRKGLPGEEGRKGRVGDSGENGNIIDPEYYRDKIHFSNTLLNMHDREQARYAIQDYKERNTAIELTLLRYGYKFDTHLKLRSPLEYQEYVDGLYDLLEKYNNQFKLNQLAEITKDNVRTFLTDVIQSKTRLNDLTSSLLEDEEKKVAVQLPTMRIEMIKIRERLPGMITRAMKAKEFSKYTKETQEAMTKKLNFIFGGIKIVASIAAQEYSAIADILPLGQEIVTFLAEGNDEFDDINCNNGLFNDFNKLMNEHKRFINNDSWIDNFQIEWMSYQSKQTHRRVKQTLQCVLKMDSDYQSEPDPEVVALENEIDNYFSASLEITKVKNKLLKIKSKTMILEKEHKILNDLNVLWQNDGKRDDYLTITEILFFDFEKNILESFYTYAKSYSFMFLTPFDFWKEVLTIFHQPLSLKLETWDNNYNKLTTLKQNFNDWLDDAKESESSIDWTTDEFVHYRFQDPELLKQLENNDSVILKVHPNNNGDHHYKIIKGVDITMVNVRIVGVYIYLYFNTSNPGKPIYLDVTHLGNNKFTDVTGQWISIDTSTLREQTKFTPTLNLLSNATQQRNAELQIAKDKFDCNEIKPTADLLGRKMCPGLYSDYLLKIPRSDDLACSNSEIRSGTNCKDLSLKELKEINFHAKVMYRPKSIH